MNIHEFQAKQILQKYGIPIPPFVVVSSIQELKENLSQKGWDSAVLKVQVHAGGRGKAGGVKIAHHQEDILKEAEELFGKVIINAQTGPGGMIAHQLLVSPLLPIAHESYMGIILDRNKKQCVLIASPIGGMDIEKVAKEQPERVLKLILPLEGKFRSYHLLRLTKFMGWSGKLAKQGIEIVNALVKAFIETDASLLEINPLVETREGELTALDAKLVVDENALFRQPLLQTFFDPTQVNPLEARAKQMDLAYIALDGDIGCMVNGAGLAMATMDLIQSFGGKAANFLDVGGSASKEKITEGFKIILSDPKVKAILVNIFGGIMDCDTLAAGVVAAVQELQLKVPLVVRLEGTHVEKGKKRILESGLPIINAKDLQEAATQVVEAAKQVKR